MKFGLYSRLPVLALGVFLLACGGEQKQVVDSETFTREIESREPKLVKDGELLADAQAYGEALVAAMDSLPTFDMQAAQSLQGKLVDTVMLVSLDSTEWSLDWDGRLYELMSSYAYAYDHQYKLEPNLQLLDRAVVYTFPATDSLEAIWWVRYSKKELVLAH